MDVARKGAVAGVPQGREWETPSRKRPFMGRGRRARLPYTEGRNRRPLP